MGRMPDDRHRADLASPLESAGHAVRCCLAPDEPQLLFSYLALCERQAAGWSPQAWCVWREATRLLLGTVSDCALPMHWRCLCLDALYRPLAGLAGTADTPARQAELAGLRWDVVTLKLEPTLPGSG